MSLKKTFSMDPKPRANVKISASQSMHKPTSLLTRIFNRNLSEDHNKNDVNPICKLDNHIHTDFKRNFLCEFEVELSYTSNVLKQRLDELNHHNLINQMNECSLLISKRLSESQKFIESLHFDTVKFEQLQDFLNQIQIAHQWLTEWIESLSCGDIVDQTVGKEAFSRLELVSKAFISRLKAGLDEKTDERKRNSIDNGCIRSNINRPLPSYKSRFSEEERAFIAKLERMKEASEQVLTNSQHIYPNNDSTKIKQEPGYQDSEILNSDSVKLESNCTGAPSFTNDDSCPYDFPDFSDQITQNVQYRKKITYISDHDQDPITDFRRSLPEKDKNIPLPEVPHLFKHFAKSKSLQVPTSFHSEEHHYRRTSLLSKDRPDSTNSAISNFSNKSPLRSPSFVSCLNLQTNRSHGMQSPLFQTNPGSGVLFNSLKISSPISQDQEASQFSKTPECPLTSKEISDVLSDQNKLLNTSNRQDDFGMMSRSFNGTYLEDKIKDFKRLSNCSTDNADCLPIDTTEKKATSETIISVQEMDEPSLRTEVKSDTEEYFEYFEMNGVKYRQKMKKRTVIEKIKVQKTVFAPLLADGSGPDLEKPCGNDHNEISQALYNDHCSQFKDVLKEASLPDKAVVRRYTEEKLRVSRSMFLPYPENMKALTINNDLKNQQINMTPALLTNYMYRIGKADFEEPVIDKRLSSQLLEDVNSAWIKTEFSLPQHKSRNICYFKKSRQTYDHGNTIPSPRYIPSSRTMRVKSQDNISKLSLESQTNVAEPSIGNQDDCNKSVTTTDISNHGRSESSILCTDDEKELGSSLSESVLSALQEDTQSTVSTIDSDYHDSLIDDPSDPIPYMSTRSPSPDPGFYICDHNSFLSETKDQFSFILLESNPIPFLIFDKDTKPGECDIAGGPVDALIVYACDGEENLLFLGAFLDTYRTFIEPRDLIKRLIIRYKYFRSKQSVDDKDFNAKREDSGYTDSSEDIVRHRRKLFDSDDPEKKCIHILSLLLTIIGKLKRDLNEHISSLIMSFESFLQEIGETQWIHAINNTIKNQKQAMEKDTEMVQIVNQMTLRPQSLTDSKSPSKEKNSPTKGLSYFITYKESILEFSSYEIAEQMTLLDWGKYRDVELIEILNLKDIANCKLTGVIEYAKHFENVQYWTQSILLDPDKKTTSERDKYCVKFLRIMKHLRKQCNFSSLIAILLGIQLLPLDKLFSKRVRSKIIEMDDYMKPTKFIGYKEDLKQAVAPCIPFLGIFYQDVVMLNIANPPFLDGNEIDYVGRLSIWSTHNNQTIPLNIEHYGPIVNFWRSFKQYLFLKNCNKDQDKIRYSIKANEKILQFLGNYRERYDEATIQRLLKEI